MSLKRGTSDVADVKLGASQVSKIYRGTGLIWEKQTADIIAANMDVLNLQSDNPANFVLNSSTISQWTDLSPSLRHAVQATAASQPAYNGGSPLWSGNTFLQYSQYSANVFSAYYVFRANARDTAFVIGGGSSSNNYIVFNFTGSQVLQVNNSSSGGGESTFLVGGEHFYTVLSLRRNASGMSLRANGRRLVRITNGNGTANQLFSILGRGSAGFTLAGRIRAHCISSQYIDDATDLAICQALQAKYGLPETSDCIIGFGDSITRGTGATTDAERWLNKLGTALSKGIKNTGIPSSLLTNATGTTDNGQNRWEAELVEAPYTDTICMLYGTNDVSASIASATYAASLDVIVSGLLAKGYAASKIILGTIPYQQGNANSTRIGEYNTAITNICTSRGLKAPAQVYANMLSGGGDSLMADSVHPNNAGHTVIKNAFQAAIQSA